METSTLEFIEAEAGTFSNHASSWMHRHAHPPLPATTAASERDFAAMLLAMAGHDLRQPLQIITSAHDILATMLGNERERGELAHAAEATARLARMLGQMVEALHLHRQSGESLAASVALPPLLQRLAAEFERPARLKGLALRFTTPTRSVLSNPLLLTSILRNLIRNAIDYTPSGGSISVGCRRCGPELRIEVRDTGAGIRSSAFPTIFAAFERVDESRIDGLGLGLFIVKRAADILGHRIEVRSVEGRGSCFTVVGRAANTKRRRRPAPERAAAPRDCHRRNARA